MPVFHLDNLDDPRLEPYRSLKQSNAKRDAGLFVAEGKLVVQRLLESDFEVVSVLLSELRQRDFLPLVPPEVPTYVLPQRLAERLVGYNFHTGVVACGRRRERDLPPVVFDASRASLLVCCPNVTDPENLGTVIRLSCGFGVDALLLGPGCCDPFSRRVLRVSMGNALFLPIFELRDLRAWLTELRDEWDYELVATVLDDSAEPLERADRYRRTVLLLGNEARGLDPQDVALCDRRVTIPMHGRTDSLNVSVAAGIFLYHFQRYAAERRTRRRGSSRPPWP